jgi:Domain of unknown function (DUF4838)
MRNQQSRRPVRLELERGWRLSADISGPEVALAAAELEESLGPSGDVGFEVLLARGEGGGDGFRRRAAPQRLELHGDSPRGLLFGAYATLEELGERWPWPGERRARPRGAPSIEEEVERDPALPGRCLALGERALLDDGEDWIVWAARNRLNSIFVHVSAEEDPVGAAPESYWLDRRERLVGLARERGMALEHGGHLLPELLPHHQLQALVRGGRLDEGARRTVEQYALGHPEAEVVHLWGADVPGGAGGGRDASEAALRMANALAEAVEAVRPEAEVAFLAYHETEEVPRGVKPRPNVCLAFAPRERCYQHALTDPDCNRNGRYRELLLAQLEHFRAAGAAPARVFEYWFDAIRFSGGVPDLSRPMADDLAFYRDAGVHTVQMLITGHGGPPPPHPNPPAFARLSWNPGGWRDQD